jgi:riboflavin transporter FmnP
MIYLLCLFALRSQDNLRRVFLCLNIKGDFMTVYKYIKTAQIAMRAQTNGGIIYLFPNILLNVMYLLPLMFLWRVIAGSGVDAGMTLSQLLTYTYINALLEKYGMDFIQGLLESCESLVYDKILPVAKP